MNADARPAVHVVFNMSAAASIRQALERLDCRERIIGLMDDLSFGPIDPPSVSLRKAWIETSLVFDLEEVVEMADLFWAEATSADILPVAWVCRRNAEEYAGFLEFIWRKGDAPFRVIDVTNIQFAKRNRSGTFHAQSLGLLNREQIIDARLLHRQATLAADEIEGCREIWRRLRKENAPLRIVDETGLVSAPITYFDDDLVSCATDEWQKGPRIVGETMVKLWETPLDQCPRDMVLWSRVCALGEAGALEISGDAPKINACLVRRRHTPSHRDS